MVVQGSLYFGLLRSILLGNVFFAHKRPDHAPREKQRGICFQGEDAGGRAGGGEEGGVLTMFSSRLR